MGNQVNHENRRARYDYEFLETWTAGVSLLGSEVKAIKQYHVDFNGAWCEIRNGEVFCKNLTISETNSDFTHQATRERKLLLTHKEIKKMDKMMDKGLSIIPLRIFVNDRGLIKMSIAAAKGKKNWDKRETIKKRDQLRESQL